MRPARLPSPLPFVPVEELGGRPHVMVDGAPRPGTLLTLSHWPSSPTPGRLARDLSAEIALAYLTERRHWCAGCEAVSVDHLDQDGLTAAFVLADPAGAAARAELLVEVARAGDFAVVRDERAARVSMALDGLAAAGLGPRELVELLPSLLDEPTAYESHYRAELESLRASQAALASGSCALREVRPADLAIFEVDDRLPSVQWRRFGRGGEGPLHPMALHSATAAGRVLVVQGRRLRYHDRYETWVRLASRRPPLRRDLVPLAARLSEAEPDGRAWGADGPATLEPVLAPGGGESTLDAAFVTETICAYLLEAPPAWDPYRAGGAFLAAGAEAGHPAARGGAERPLTRGVSGRAGPRAGTSARGPARHRGRFRARPSA